MPKGNVFTAPRCRILLNGKIIARGTNISYRISEEHADVEVLDNYEVDEFAPVAYRVSGSIGQVKTRNITAKSQGMLPRVGKDSDEHLENVILQDYATLQILDKKNPPTTLRTFTSVVFDGMDFSLASRGVAQTNISWKAIRETDESEASV